MKKLFILFLTCIFCQLAQAQTTDSLDHQRLLEYYQAQQYAEAAQYLQRIYTDSNDVNKLKQLAYSNLMAGNISEAEKNYLRLNTQLPENTVVLTALADIKSRLNQDDEATWFYLAAIKIDSNNFNAYKKLAKLENDSPGTSKKAYLLKANQLNPRDAEVAAALADSYFRANQFSKAEETLKPALAADSSSLILLNAKVPVSMALEKYPEAIKAGRTLLEKYGTPSENLFFQMALSHREIKDYKTAIAYLEKAIKAGISTKIASYYGLLGDSYENINQNKEAIKVYKRGLLFENNGSLYYNIALVYENKLNDKKNAINYYTQYLNSIKDPEKQKRHIAFIKNKIEELKR